MNRNSSRSTSFSSEIKLKKNTLLFVSLNSTIKKRKEEKINNFMVIREPSECIILYYRILLLLLVLLLHVSRNWVTALHHRTSKA